MSPSILSQFPATHSFAQTNVQIFNQIKGGYTQSEIEEVLQSYALASELFSGVVRGSGKPFLAHAVGTASIVAALSAPVHLVISALLHAAYTHGHFGGGNRGASPANRQRVRDIVGEESEELIYRYTNLVWRESAAIPRIVQRLAAFSHSDRSVLLVRLANELEEYLDLGILYCEDVERRIQFCELYGPYMVELAGKLGAEPLSQWLTQAFEQAQLASAVQIKDDFPELSSANAFEQTGGAISSAVQENAQLRKVKKIDADRSWGTASTDHSIVQAFKYQAILHPDQIAVECIEKITLYGALDAQSDQIARSIVAEFGPGNDPIVTLSGHDETLAVLAFAIWKAGKIWIPLDATHPVHRLSLIVQDTKARCILCDDKLKTLARSVSMPGQTVRCQREMDDVDSSRALLPDVSADELACVLYTSGSTGQPKGVVHNHRNLVHLARRGARALRIDCHDRLTLLPSCSQIAGITDLLRALLNGATLLPYDVRGNPVKRLAQWLVQRKISLYHSSPSLFRMLAESLDKNEKVPHVRAIHLGGEAVSQEDLEIYKRHFSANCVLMNNLGCTEISGYCQKFIGHDFVSNKNVIPAGHAVEGVSVAVWDEHGTEVPKGQTGEIVVTSPYLALGYWQRPKETQMSFLNCPAGSRSRSYRTGDLGYMLPDNSLVFIGRTDGQVQIRGNRVDVAEIESTVAAHPLVQRVAVKVYRTQKDPIMAFVVPREEGALSLSALRQFIKMQLPTYMMPSVRIVSDLPLTPNGKIDYELLGQEFRVLKPNKKVGNTPPRTRTERSLARLWREFVEAESISVEDDFFALGGDSLMVIRLVNRIGSVFDIEASMHDIFQHPTLGDLATVVAARNIGRSSGRLSNLQQHALLTSLSEIEARSDAQSQQELDTLLGAVNTDQSCEEPEMPTSFPHTIRVKDYKLD